MNAKIIKLDINKKLYQRITAKQRDVKSRYLFFHLLDGAIPFNLTGKSVRVYAIKPDKTEIFNDLQIVDAAKGVCKLELTTQILEIDGIVFMEIMVTEGLSKLTSNIFELEVGKSINSEAAIISTNEFTALVNGLASLSEYDSYKSELKSSRGSAANLPARLAEIDLTLTEKAHKQYVDNKADYLTSQYNATQEFVTMLMSEQYTITSAFIENKKYQGNKNLGDVDYKVDTTTRVCTKTEYVSNGKISILFDDSLYDMYYLEYDSLGKFIVESDWFISSPSYISVKAGNKIGVILAKKDKSATIAISEFNNGNFKIVLLPSNKSIEDSSIKLNNTANRLINNQSGVHRFGTWNTTFAHTKYNEIPKYIIDNNLNFLGMQEYRGGETLSTLACYTTNTFMPKYHLCPSIPGLAILATSNLYKVSDQSIELGMHGGTEKRVVSKQELYIKGKKASVYTVHLDYLAGSNAPQLQECLTMLMNDDSYYKVMLGDFNVIKTSDFDIFTNAGYKISNGKDGVWYETFKDDNGASTKCIDNIIVSSNIDIIDVNMINVPREIADHNLLIADLEFSIDTVIKDKVNILEEDVVKSKIQIVDIMKQLLNSNIAYDGTEWDNVDTRIEYEVVRLLDRINNAKYLPYEGNFITANDSYEGMTRDNVVKGKTLQNIIKHVSWTLSNDKGSAYMNVDWNLLKPNTKYTYIVNKLSSKIDAANAYVGKNFTVSAPHNVAAPVVITSVNDLNGVTGVKQPHLYAKEGETLTLEDVSSIRIMLLEGDYTNKPIPSYFEGIKSVNEDGENLEQVSCGKNLFNGKISSKDSILYEQFNGEDCVKFKDGEIYSYIGSHFKSNTQYTFTSKFYRETGDETKACLLRIVYTDGTVSNMNFIHGVKASFTSDKNKSIKEIRTTYNFSRPMYMVINETQLEEGTVATPYEPYVEDRLSIKMKNLRSVGNVCDTSDGVRRVGKFVLKGTEPFMTSTSLSNNDTMYFGLGENLSIEGFTPIDEILIGNNAMMCNEFKLYNCYDGANTEEGFCKHRNSTLMFRINKSRLAEQTTNGFKQWLKQKYDNGNPIVVYYPLRVPTKEEGNIEEFRTYDEITNIFTEGSLIEPIISCKVPSNVQAVVMNLRSENQTLNNDVNTLQATTEENNLMNIETNVNQEARLTMLELGVI